MPAMTRLQVLANTSSEGKEMIVVFVIFVLIARHVECIVSKGTEAPEEKGDNVPGQSISRGFSYGNEGRLGYDLGEGYEHFGGNYDAGKYYGYEEHYKHEHKEHDPAYYKALALKGLLIPLAGAALLGAAAAFVSNPILLQLGVISSTYGRKRRDTRSQQREKYQVIQLLERFMAQVPREEIQSQEERLFAKYLTCSGATSENACLERLACELHSAEGASMPVETNVMAIITNEILSNKFVSDTIKSRIVKAVQRGRTVGACTVYTCPELAKLTDLVRKRSRS